MKVQVHGRAYFGTPEDIVRQLYERDHGRPRDVDAYMRRVASGLALRVEGGDVADRCEAFLVEVIWAGFALLVCHPEHVDADAIRLLGKVHDLSRARGAAREATSRASEKSGDDRLGATWSAERVQSFARCVASRAADWFTRDPGCPGLTVEELRAVVREAGVEVLGRTGVLVAHELPCEDDAERVVLRRRVAELEAVVRAAVAASEVRSMVGAAMIAGIPEGASSLAILERSLDADVVATRVFEGLAGRSSVGLRAEERAILRRLRDNEARARSSIGHLGEDIRRQCDATIALLEYLMGPEVTDVASSTTTEDRRAP